VRTYIDDLLCLTKGSFEDHLEKLERVLHRLQEAGLKVNGNKSFFAKTELEYLGYWITRDGIKPLPDKVKAILAIDAPRNRKELRSFIGIINYYRDMWVRRSHVLAPLASLTSNKAKWSWGPQQEVAFQTAKKIIAREVMLAYPDFNKPFEIHTDASHYQLGSVISQDGKPIAFYSRKLNPAQTCYTTTERELLSIVETLKEYRNILLGHQIEVFTDHKNLVYKTFNTERVMRWHLIIEEFGPKLTYIKGVNNVVADALSRMKMTEKDFGPEVFAGEKVKQKFPLSYKLLAEMQAKDNKLQKRLQSKDQTTYVYKRFKHSDKEYKLVTRDDKIVIPKSLERKVTKWYHEHLLHPGETRLELTLKQHFTFIGLKPMCVKVCKACNVCRTLKANHKKYGKVPPKAEPELVG
jgi:RNase H-like domain found in reverse transcriptase/Integrase zinc binding domain/Reverse transcriptase (RNA-dependent DNA polymerase)